MTYGLPTFLTSSEHGGQMYAGMFPIKTGVLLQGHLVEYRPQQGSFPRKGVFYCAGWLTRGQAGSQSHVSLKALMCTTEGAAFDSHPALTKLGKLDDSPVQFTSGLWRNCVAAQKKHIATLAVHDLAATVKWENDQKREETKTAVEASSSGGEDRKAEV